MEKESVSSSRVADTPELLIDAAKRAFAKHGYDGATVKEIADEAGVNVSLVSYHFKGKENLYSACLERFGKARLEAATRILKGPTSVEDFRVRLSLLVEEVFQTHVDEKDITAILHRECISDHAITRQIFVSYFVKLFQTLVDFMKTAQKAGIVRENADPHASALLFWGGIIHICRTDPVHKQVFGKSISDRKFRDQLLEQAVGNLFQGILKR